MSNDYCIAQMSRPAPPPIHQPSGRNIQNITTDAMFAIGDCPRLMLRYVVLAGAFALNGEDTELVVRCLDRYIVLPRPHLIL